MAFATTILFFPYILINYTKYISAMSKSTVRKMEKRSSPDETITFENGNVEIAKVGDTTIGRGYFEPSWTWEKSIKPMAKTESCQLPHTAKTESCMIC